MLSVLFLVSHLSSVIFERFFVSMHNFQFFQFLTEFHTFSLLKHVKRYSFSSFEEFPKFTEFRTHLLIFKKSLYIKK